MRSVLIIDDSDDYRSTLAMILLDYEFDVWEATCPDEAFKLLSREHFDLIMCDLHMPFTFGERFHEYPYSFEVGIRTIKELGGVYPDRPIIAMTAASPSQIDELKKQLGDLPLLSKPFPAEELMLAIAQSLNQCCSTPMQ